MLNAVVHSPMLFFDTTPLGRVINRFARDVSVIDDNIPYTTQSFLSTTMQVVSTIVSIAIATPWVILPMVPIALIYIVVQAFYVAASRQLKRLDRTTRSPIYAHYGESYNGAATISAFARDAAFEIQNQGFHDVHNAAYYASVSANRWLALRLDFVGNLVSFVTAFFAIYQRDSLDPGLVGLALSYAMAVTKVVSSGAFLDLSSFFVCLTSLSREHRRLTGWFAMRLFWRPTPSRWKASTNMHAWRSRLRADPNREHHANGPPRVPLLSRPIPPAIAQDWTSCSKKCRCSSNPARRLGLLVALEQVSRL
eukprot:m.865714 g.865714  ORF g.865714 m.865714 type:complete len:309 (-) comp59720_c0_seq3:784-1710(-)